MKSNYTLFTVLTLLYSIIGYSQPTTEDFTAPGFWTYTVPAGYKANITVEAWGGGGGGGGSSAGKGGGGGGYVTNTYTNVLPGDYDITVGSGGAVGSVGGTSSYKFIGTVSAGGGAGAVGNSGGGGGGIFGSHGSGSKAGGSGGVANTSGCGSEGSGTGGGAGGGGGGSGPSASAGSAASGCSGGAGGSSYGGKGGDYNNGGSQGSAPGGGGGGRGGGTGSFTPGSGGNGRVLVTVTLVASFLPVELISFNALGNEKSVNLAWATANEVNNEKFIIESSIDGEIFSSIGETQGAGTSTERHDYRFTHYTPSAGANYYRLKQIDFDGTFEYSKVVAVEMKGNNDIVIFPNPMRDKFYIQYNLTKTPTHLGLYDALGRRLNVQFGGIGGQYEVDLPGDMPKGVYWLRVEDAGKIRSIPVMKE